MTPNNKSLKIFILEDDEWYGKLLEHTLNLNPDYEVIRFTNARDCLGRLEEQPYALTLDYKLPDMRGEEVLKAIKNYNPAIEVIVISEQDDINTAVSLLKNGAYDYIVKTKDIRDRLLNTVNNIHKNKLLENQIHVLKKEVQDKYKVQHSIVGSSDSIQYIFELIEKALNNNINVTISGETGTGKELVAKAIHYNSERKDKPFVPVNMSAIPGELMESELFGHEKGAFTGAITRRIGKFEEANKGTLFLDEIGEMDFNFQAKLLRVLQEKEVMRVGSNKPIKVDCRIITATNKDLQNLVKENAFREDLYYRLIGLPIHIPPLRERKKDILLLTKHFIKKFCESNALEVPTLSPDAQQKLLGYNYPGNVRELKAVIELSVVMGNGEIKSEHINFANNEVLTGMLNEELTLKEYELQIIKAFLEKYDGNIKLVAKKLNIGQSTIYRVLKENGIKIKRYV